MSRREAGTARTRILAAALLAVAAVVAIVLTVVLRHTHSSTPTGSATTGARPTSGPGTMPPPSGSTSTAPSVVAFALAGSPVAPSGYERGTFATGQPLQPTPGSVQFTTPSGNITCGMAGPATTASVSCLVAEASYPTPDKPADCPLNWAATALSIAAGRAHRGLCLGGAPFPPVSSVLPYGSTLRYGPIACRSDAAYLACADVDTGHGFEVSRTVVKTY